MKFNIPFFFCSVYVRKLEAKELILYVFTLVWLYPTNELQKFGFSKNRGKWLYSRFSPGENGYKEGKMAI